MMDAVVQITVTAVFALLAAAAAGILLGGAAVSLSRARTSRRALSRRLAQLPMGALLERLGGDRGTYLQATSAEELRERLQRCAGCGEAARCRRLLNAPVDDITAFGFCPNFAALRAQARRCQPRWNPYCNASATLPPTA